MIIQSELAVVVHTILLVVALRLSKLILGDRGRGHGFIANFQGRIHRRLRVLYSGELHVGHTLNTSGLLGTSDENRSLIFQSWNNLAISISLGEGR